VINLSKIAGFDWDKGNIDKSYLKHGITPNEAEQIFLDKHLFFQDDINHSDVEERFIGIGRTSGDKMLFTAFTARNNKIRIISARRANIKERRLYEKKAKENSKI